MTILFVLSLVCSFLGVIVGLLCIWEMWNDFKFYNKYSLKHWWEDTSWKNFFITISVLLWGLFSVVQFYFHLLLYAKEMIPNF